MHARACIIEKIMYFDMYARACNIEENAQSCMHVRAYVHPIPKGIYTYVHART